jgi:pilus assembly protein Flp/PilA
MRNFIKRFSQDESGATMVEYGLMIALIAVVCIGAVRALGTNVQGSFNASSNAMGAMTQQSCISSGGTYNPAQAGPPLVAATCTYAGQ